MPITSSSKFILAIRLKDLAEAQKISFKKLSEQSGVPIKTLYGWTAGNQPRKMQDLKAVADCLNVCMDDLIFAPPSPNPSKASHWIALCRENLKYNQIEAAVLVELSAQELNKYETQTDVPFFVFLKIMKAYGQSEDSVLAKISEFYSA